MFRGSASCFGCGADFTPHRRDQIACSAACSSTAFAKKNRVRLNDQRRLRSRVRLGLPAGASETETRRAVHIKDVVDYSHAHQRVSAQRGKASEHACTDCGDPAAEWSYTHTDPDERTEVVQDGRRRAGGKVRELAYSLNPAFYEPRCKPCHLAFDLGRHALPRIG